MELTKEIVTKGGQFNAIITKAGDPMAVGFKTIDEKALQKISDFMPEINRALTSFSKQNSQTTASLMSLNMMDNGPYRVLRQILAQINKKRGALKEVTYSLEKKKLDYIDMKEKQDAVEAKDIDLEWNKRELELNKTASDIIDSASAVEACLKEIGAYQERYKEVMNNNDIPDNWDEEDFEAAEVEHHIKSIFRNAVKDRMQGSHNMGTLEYMSQFGINGVVAYGMVDSYLANIKKELNVGRYPDINTEYAFYDQMYKLFKDEYKKAMARVGLDSVTHADYLMKEAK
jgi:hypothetical protein